MPKGLSKIQQLATEAAARSAAYEAGEGQGQRALKLQPGESATGRFCEEGEGVWYVYMHELPKKPGQQYGDRVQCLDQNDEGKECPGCELDGVKRTARVVINFIRYDEPKLRRGADGKAVKDNAGNYIFDGVEPALVVFETSQTTGGRIAYLEAENNGGDPSHGITNHVVKITRPMAKKEAPMIDVKEVDKPVSDIERELFKKALQPDKAIQNVFPRFMSRPVMSVGDMRRAFSGVSVPSGFQGGDSGSQPQENGQGNIYQQQADNAAGRGRMNLGAFG